VNVAANFLNFDVSDCFINLLASDEFTFFWMTLETNATGSSKRLASSIILITGLILFETLRFINIWFAFFICNVFNAFIFVGNTPKEILRQYFFENKNEFSLTPISSWEGHGSSNPKKS